MQERDNPREFGLFEDRIPCRTVSSFFVLLVSGRKIPLAGVWETLLFLNYLLLPFSFIFLDFMLQKPMVFHDIPSDCIQHELFIHFFL